jgi:alpha-galactosidase
LLTNPEVLALNQDSRLEPARRKFVPGLDIELWVRELHGGAHAVGLFNRSSRTVQVSFAWEELGFTNGARVRDLWRRQDLARAKSFVAEISAHDCELLRVE